MLMLRMSASTCAVVVSKLHTNRTGAACTRLRHFFSLGRSLFGHMADRESSLFTPGIVVLTPESSLRIVGAPAPSLLPPPPPSGLLEAASQPAMLWLSCPPATRAPPRASAAAAAAVAKAPVDDDDDDDDVAAPPVRPPPLVVCSTAAAAAPVRSQATIPRAATNCVNGAHCAAAVRCFFGGRGWAKGEKCV